MNMQYSCDFILTCYIMNILYFLVELFLEFLFVLCVYALVSYFMNKFSKKSKKKFSFKETISESWLICFVIALVIVITSHVI